MQMGNFLCAMLLWVVAYFIYDINKLYSWIAIGIGLFYVFSIIRLLGIFRKTYIRLENDRIVGFIKGPFAIMRNDVQAAYISALSGSERLFFCVIEDGFVDVPCEIFNLDELDCKLTEYFGNNVYSDYSFLMIPYFIKYFEDLKDSYRRLDQPLVLKTGGLYNILAFISMLVCLTFTYLAWKSQLHQTEFIFFVILMAFTFLGSVLFILLSKNKIIITKESIKFNSIFRKVEILWTELERIEVSQKYFMVFLSSGSKTIEIPSIDQKKNDLISVYEIIDYIRYDKRIPVRAKSTGW